MRGWLLAAVLLWPVVARAESPAPSPSPSPSPSAPSPSASAPSQAAPAAPRNRAPVYRLDAAIDVPVTVAGFTLWVLPYFVTGNSTAPPYCDPCDKSKVNALDRAFAGRADPAARTAANVWLALPGVYAIADIADVGARHWRSYLTDFVVIGETIAWDGALQEIVRRAVRRPRPYMYAPNLYPSDRVTAEGSFSFYSGHTSYAFSIASSFSYTFMLRHPRSKWIWAVWASTLTVASIEPILRVESGDHFPTDVIVAALVGTSFGVLIPALHRLKIPARLSISPSSAGADAGLSLRGSF